MGLSMSYLRLQERLCEVSSVWMAYFLLRIQPFTLGARLLSSSLYVTELRRDISFPDKGLGVHFETELSGSEMQ